MTTENVTCLINESDCGRVAGNPVCPKCGMDERVIYPGQDDLEAGQVHARRIYIERELKDCLDSNSQELEGMRQKYGLVNERLLAAEVEMAELKKTNDSRQLLVDDLSGANVVRDWFVEIGLSKDDVLKSGISIAENFFTTRFVRVWVLIALLAMVLLLVACGKKEDPFPWESQVASEMADLSKTKLLLELCRDNYYAQRQHILGSKEKAIPTALLTCISLLAWVGVRRMGLLAVNINNNGMQINKLFVVGKRIRWRDIERCEYVGDDLWRLVVSRFDDDAIGSSTVEFALRIGGKCNVKGYTHARGLALINNMISDGCK